MRTYIWKFICIVGLLSLTYGCAYFEERGDAMAACGNDPKCIEKVIGAGKIGNAIGNSTGLPWAGAAAGGLAGLLVAFFARKKEEK